MSHVLRVPWEVSEVQGGGDNKHHWDVLARDEEAEGDGRDDSAAAVTRMKLVPAAAAL